MLVPAGVVVGLVVVGVPDHGGAGDRHVPCALAFPDRQEELQPELWGVAAAAAE